jgi:hypothetical protein
MSTRQWTAIPKEGTIMSKYVVETVTDNLTDSAEVEAQNVNQASFIAGAMFGAAAVITLPGVYELGALLGIDVVQGHIEDVLKDVLVYTDYV